MRNINKIPIGSRYDSQDFSICSPIYSCGETTTTDITKADLDPYGSPIVVRVDSSITTPHEIYSKSPRLSFNPADPNARSLAFEARSAFEAMPCVPTNYTDKFEFAQYANNVSDILFPKIVALKENSNFKNE